jgi:Zn-dependent protease/predicted transcriptional regulator
MNGVPVARILGFEVRLHISWLFIVAIVTVTVADRISVFQPQIDPAASWTIGFVGSLGFMFTAIAHELAHAIAARRDGAESEAIIVNFIGSPAAVDIVASSPRAEAIVAVAGPLASAAIGAGFCVVALALLNLGGPVGPIADVLVIIGALDLLLAAINLVPAFPLDGGRLVRAMAWARLGDQHAGTRVAGTIGRWTGRALLIVGLAIILAGDVVDGVMIALVGWFLMASARSVARYAILDRLVQGLRVGEAMEEQLETITPQLTLDTFAPSILDGTVGPALPVVSDEAVVGIVGLAQIRRIPRRSWSSTRTADVMVGGAAMPTAGPEDRLTDALERLRRSHLDGLPVVEGTTLLGVLTRRSIAAILHARAEASGQAL